MFPSFWCDGALTILMDFFSIFMTSLFVTFRPLLKRGHLIQDIIQTFFSENENQAVPFRIILDYEPFHFWKNVEVIFFQGYFKN